MKIFEIGIARAVVTVATIALLAFSASTASAFYNPQTGRWLNRDPIGEIGGKNLMALVCNNPVGRFDRNGLEFNDLGYYTVFAAVFDTFAATSATFIVDGMCNPTADCHLCSLQLTRFSVTAQSWVSLYEAAGPAEPFPRFSDEFINSTILHEARHRDHFRAWHDANLARAAVDFSGVYSCDHCRHRITDLRTEWDLNFSLYRIGELNHSNPGWEDYSGFSTATYAGEEDWWYGPVPYPLDPGPFEDPFGRF